MDFVKHVHFNDPDQLLSFLELEDPLWKDITLHNSSDGRLVFRGQALSSWGLHNKLARKVIDNEYCDNLLTELSHLIPPKNTQTITVFRRVSLIHSISLLTYLKSSLNPYIRHF
jgi:hypothetical protein